MSGPIVLILRAILAISLYAFLAWALVNLWRDVKLQGQLLAAQKIPVISLSIDRKDSKTRIQQFVLPEVTIGRDPACECPVDDNAISARHARLSYHHHQWWLEDLVSANGVLLNQEKLTMPTVITTGDEFICGETRFSVSLANEIFIPGV
jgi:pSer/pThr/pTyr-binding forkhead associated (FHA) protein